MEEALSRIAQDLPAAALVDIGLPGMDGVGRHPAAQGKIPGNDVLMLTVYEDDERIFAALCAGASGYLAEKDGRPRDCSKVARGHRGRRAAISGSGAARDEALHEIRPPGTG